MNEKNYCISRFKDNFERYKGRRIALYGKIDFILSIFRKFPEFGYAFIVNDDDAGKYVDQNYIVSFAQVLDLQIEFLILVDDIYASIKLYEKISIACNSYNIKIFNLYGQNMHDIVKSTTLKYCTYAQLKEFDLQDAIDKHDIISFDIDNTLFTVKNIYYSDFYAQVEKRLNEISVNIYDFIERLDAIRRRDQYSNMRSILQELARELCLSGDELEIIWVTMINEARKAFVPRMALIGTVMYAISKGKTVYIVEDMPEYRLPKIVWDILLNDYGISRYDCFLSSLDFCQHKGDGLFRNMIEQCGENKKYLHVGDEIENDVLLPSLYGIDTFWIKSPIELFDNLDAIILEQLESKRVRYILGECLAKIYSDVYLFEGARIVRLQYKDLIARLQNEIELSKNNNEIKDAEPVLFKPVLFNIEEDENKGYSELKFPIYDTPKVSIIIPAYNQFKYTYNCLYAILKHTVNVEYEIIVADDCSDDKTKEIDSIVSGITIIHNKKNIRFLLNCNNAATYAKGKYILFLNNDTQVQHNWLLPLVYLIEGNNNIGMVGSKLVYPDGYLQEAGGIVWNDGSAYNYGNRENPDSYGYCYVKESDYISSAAIMIKASLWRKVGGFDPIYSPGYYEDTDLAFKVRKQGYKVCLQPESVVVHFEGVSNGVDTSVGLKKYQIINQKKFYEKWRNILDKEHFVNGADVYLAKDRGQFKKQILVIDHYVPNYDRDAGGRCTFMYLKIFLKMGMKVTFIGDKFVRTEPYTTQLMQMGVEVIFGDFYRINCKEWLKKNLKYFEYIYLQRPNVAIKYIDIVKEYGHGKVFYFAHDLYHVRSYRDYLVTGNESSLQQSKEWKAMEMELFEKADVGHVVGTYERKLMNDLFPNKPIRNIPLYIYDEFPVEIQKDFSKRENIMFVGGFNHKPNLDAVLWFAEKIYPKILEKYPDMVWHVIGGNVPQEVQNIASDNIVLEGFISDEQLEILYRRCRLAVVPLRFGAGVKGKIVEAAYYQIPMVTTSIGGEGLDQTDGAFLIEDDADKMADLIINLYSNYAKLKEMSNAGKVFIKKYFTPEIAKNVLCEDMK